ncbi:MAG: hypothetical protein JW742_01595 [Candidatus Aminicenantes bacterium]|nr:hypothetical protein [Candidatus Aminicenantes bacterium]
MNVARAAVDGPWLERTLAEIIRDAAENRSPDGADGPLFGPPAVGVVDGDDPLFEAFAEAVDSRHLRPRAFLERHAPRGSDLTCVRVVAWALPYAENIRRSNRRGDWPSSLYSLARNLGGALCLEAGRRMARALEAVGGAALSPALTGDADAFRSPTTVFSSTWSERHVAYAAGLGVFGLNGGLITRLGIHVRLGSLVTNLPVPCAAGPPRGGHRAPCLADGGASCGLCIGRCPVGAVSRDGLDKAKCNGRRKAVQSRAQTAGPDSGRLLAHRQIVNGRPAWRVPLGCALCQCGVPCEGSNPFV